MTDHLYHAAPLHYLPHILQGGALYAQTVLGARRDGPPIAPRATAARRDRMLGLADYVHLSLRPDTPLLADKLRRGYPHALLVFDGPSVLARPDTALVPYNAKSWHSKAAFTPVSDPAGRTRLLTAHRRGRYPSLEVLVKYGLDLAPLRRVAFLTDNERDMIARLTWQLSLPSPAPLETDAALFPRVDGYLPTTGDALAAYFARCAEAGTLLPPPALPFD